MSSKISPILTYRIDLSLPPSERYVSLAKAFAPQMRAMTTLFDEILTAAIPWTFPRRIVKFLASKVLRHVYSSEETNELRGISKASGVEMYLLVAMNVILDSLLGCTSGAVMTQPRKNPRSTSTDEHVQQRMMHFRTLDWSMDALRNVLVVLEFVRSNSEEPNEVIARTVTYVGFVGALTGVRKNLSVSFNFRPTHRCSDASLYLHQALVLFGFRRSVASVLRTYLLPPGNTYTLPLEAVTTVLKKTYVAPCYIVLCSGTHAFVVEKDLNDGQTRSADDFIAATNHDIAVDSLLPDLQQKESSSNYLGMESLLEDSEDRLDCVTRKWSSLKRRQEQKQKKHTNIRTTTSVIETSLKGWVKAYPTTNECTHFGCILDPILGTIRWISRGYLAENEDEN